MKKILLIPALMGVILPTAMAEKPLITGKTIRLMMWDMAKDDGIDKAEAEKIGLEIWRQLWGGEDKMKVSVEESDDKKYWNIQLSKNNPVAASGCDISLEKRGHIESVSYIMGE